MHGIYDSDTTDVLECTDCGLQYLSPLMTEEEEAAYYDGYYRKQQSRRFREMDLVDQQNQSCRHYEQYRDVYLPLISNCTAVLEIGGGTGGFLRFLSECRPETRFVATERCGENAEFIRKSFGQASIVEDLADLRGRVFDCVLALGVFEHLRDSRAFLREMRDLVRPRGTLVLKVPNKHNPLVTTYGIEEFKKFMYMKQHYYTFTEKAFELLAADTGYAVAGFHYLQCWGLDNHLSWLRHRKPRDFRDMTATISKQTLDSYNRDLIDRKTTDTFMAVLVRED
jgi:SAM-dependent methyltransferase